MTGLLLLALVAFGAIVALALTLRRERALRIAAENRARAMDEERANEAAGRRRMVAVAAHELRSPVSVILGYHELIADGMYGELDERGQEALGRIRQAAEHQLRILEGTVDLVAPGSQGADAIAPIDLRAVTQSALSAARVFATAYSVDIDAEPPGGMTTLITDGERLRRALDMVFVAAVKGSPGRHVTFRVHTTGHGAVFTLGPTGLDPGRDEPGGTDGRPLRIDTGAALRIAIARSILGPNGTIRLAGSADAATLELQVNARAPAGVPPVPSD